MIRGDTMQSFFAWLRKHASTQNQDTRLYAYGELHNISITGKYKSEIERIVDRAIKDNFNVTILLEQPNTPRNRQEYAGVSNRANYPGGLLIEISPLIDEYGALEPVVRKYGRQRVGIAPFDLGMVGDKNYSDIRDLTVEMLSAFHFNRRYIDSGEDPKLMFAQSIASGVAAHALNSFREEYMASEIESHLLSKRNVIITIGGAAHVKEIERLIGTHAGGIKELDGTLVEIGTCSRMLEAKIYGMVMAMFPKEAGLVENSVRAGDITGIKNGTAHLADKLMGVEDRELMPMVVENLKAAFIEGQFMFASDIPENRWKASFQRTLAFDGAVLASRAGDGLTIASSRDLLKEMADTQQKLYWEHHIRKDINMLTGRFHEKNSNSIGSIARRGLDMDGMALPGQRTQRKPRKAF
jgi:hypothetical protein